MADRGDDRRPARDHGAAQRLVAEREQVLDAPAAARQHDHVDVGMTVEFGQCVDDRRDGAGALDGDVADLEGDARPAAAGVFDDVPFGRAGPSGQQADPSGQERERLLAVRGEQALGGEHFLQRLDPGEQRTQTDWADLVRDEPERAAARPHLRLDPADDPRALLQRHVETGEDDPRHCDLHGYVRGGVAQGQERDALTGTDVRLGDLAFDPDAAEPSDPVRDGARDCTQR